MGDVPLTLLTTVEDVLALAAELGEHDISPAALRAWTARLEARIAGYADAPAQEGRRTRRSWRCSPGSGPGWRCCRWWRRSRRASGRPGAIDYADQVAYAARIAVASAEVGRRERARWKVVLLDEYQDTSVGQLRMLEALFGRDTGHPVLAVGDPRQSIYGWRGRLGRHHRALRPHLPGPRRAAGPSGSPSPPAGATTRPCSPSPTPSRRCCRRRTQPLPDLAPAPTAGRGAVTVGLYDTVAEETAALADRLAACWHGDGPGGRRRAGRPAARRSPCWCAPASSCPASPPRCASAACRWRSSGWAGCSRCPRSPTSSPPSPCWSTRPPATRSAGCSPAPAGGSARATSPRSRRRARALVHSRRPARAGDDGAGRWPRRPAERGSIVEALDDLGGPDAYSAGGLPPAAPARRRSWPPARPARASRCPTWSTRWPAPSAWRPSWPAPPASARPAPAPTSTRCTASPPSSPSWPSCPRCRRFLGYLRDAEERERGLEPGEVAVNPEAVQLLTGHSAKGLEWDVVAVPGHDRRPVPGRRPTPATPGSRTRAPCPPTCGSPTARSCPAAAAGARLRRPGGGEAGARGVRRRTGRTSAPARRSASATSRSPGPGTCCSARAAGGGTAVKPCGPSSLLHTAREACEDGAGTVVHWAAARRTTRRTRPWPSGRSGSGRPIRSRPGRRRALSAAAELVAGAAPHPLEPELVLAAATRSSSSGCATPTCCCASGPAHASPTRRRPAALAPVGVGAGRRCAATRPSWPAGCAGRCPRHPRRRPAGAPPSTPGWRSGSARRSWSTSTSCPAPATSSPPPTARWPSCRRRSWPASGPTGSRPRSRCRSRPCSGPLTLRGRIDAVFADGDGGFEVIDWKTGPPPSGAELAAAAVQLAAYRLGWSRLTGVPGGAGAAPASTTWPRRDPAPGRPARRAGPARPGHRNGAERRTRRYR